MKKQIALLLTMVLCLCLCACGEGAETTVDPTVESISVNRLISDTDNEAKATLNVGKATTVYGIIDKVSSSNCTVSLVYPKGSSIYVQMPIEELAELNVGQFIAVEGIVTAYSSRYTVEAKTRLDLTAMDDYVRKTITDIHAMRVFIDFSGDINAGMIHVTLTDAVNMTLVKEYVRSRGDAFLLTDDAQLKEYLIGTWVYNPYYGGLDADSCEYKTDGTYLWQYKEESFTGSVRDDSQTGDWSVSKGNLESFRGSDTMVYVLCDDVFLQQGKLHIRVDYQ